MTEQQAYLMLLGYYRAQVEQRFMAFRFDVYTEANVRRLAQILTSADCQHFGLMFSGLYGNGKTTMLYALASALRYLDECRLISSAGFDGAVDLAIYSARDMAVAARGDKRDAFDAICRGSLIAIDDLGTEPAEIVDYGNVRNPFTELVEYRYAKRLPTIISTNLTPPQITERYSERVGDRLREMMDQIVFEADSYRR